MNKAQLLDALEEGRENFTELFANVDDQAMLTPDPESGWTLKDILSHLTRWEAELIKLLWQIKQGQKPGTAHFSTASFDEINVHWKVADESRPLDRILQDYHGVRNQTIHRVEAFSDRELEDPDRFPWLKGVALWRWVAESSFEHEDEHVDGVKRILNAYHSSLPSEG